VILIDEISAPLSMIASGIRGFKVADLFEDEISDPARQRCAAGGNSTCVLTW
jgi:hypothetical protein